MSYRVFDKYADEYDQWYRDNTIIWINELECVRSLEPHGITLDVGVGTGAFADAVKGFIIGLDPSLNMLVKARKRGVEAVNGFGEFLPFRSNTFDTIMLIVVLEFVDDPDKVLEEARRVLKPMGKLIICFIPRDSEWGRYYISSSGGHRFMNVAKLYTLDEVLAASLRHGFVPQDLRSTLTRGPRESVVREQPSRSCIGGFLCIKFIKIPSRALDTSETS